MIKLFEDFNEYNQIEKWLYEMGITNYTINDDLTVDVDGNVDISDMNLAHIPIQFGKVSGYFICGGNIIASLKGCPNYIGGGFRCNNNKLTSLNGCPEKVNDIFYCYDNNLTSLKYGPKSVSDTYDCSDNILTSLEGCPKIIYSDFLCFDNKITSLKGAPEYIGGNININNNSLPKPILDLYNIPLLLKHQVEYGIWNNDGSFNEQRFNIFLNDYNSDLLD